MCHGGVMAGFHLSHAEFGSSAISNSWPLETIRPGLFGIANATPPVMRLSSDAVRRVRPRDDAEVDAEAAGVPEPHVVADEVCVGGVDDGGDADVCSDGYEFEGLDLADAHAPVEDWCAGRE